MFPIGVSRLRIVFEDEIVSFGLAANAALAEIAERFGALTARRRGEPLAVNVTMTPPIRPLHSKRLSRNDASIATFADHR